MRDGDGWRRVGPERVAPETLLRAVDADRAGWAMTPARATWIFASRKPGQHGDQGKEALPWWFFGLLGGAGAGAGGPGAVQEALGGREGRPHPRGVDAAPLVLG